MYTGHNEYYNTIFASIRSIMCTVGLAKPANTRKSSTISCPVRGWNSQYFFYELLYVACWLLWSLLTNHRSVEWKKKQTLYCNCILAIRYIMLIAEVQNSDKYLVYAWGIVLPIESTVHTHIQHSAYILRIRGHFYCNGREYVCCLFGFLFST